MGDHERAHVGADERVHALGDDPQRVDVEARVGLVEDRDPRLQHRHLEDLDALLLATREPVVQVPLRELARHLQMLHRGEQVGAELLDRDRIVLAVVGGLALRVDRAAEEARDGDARDRVRVLEGEEEAALRALVGAQLEDRLAVEPDVALGDLVGRVTHQRVREGRLARAVRAHDGVLLVHVDREVDTLDDLGAVLQRDVQVRDLEQCHRCPSVAGSKVSAHAGRRARALTLDGSRTRRPATARAPVAGARAAVRSRHALRHRHLGVPDPAPRAAARLRAEAPARDGSPAGQGDARVQGLGLGQGRRRATDDEVAELPPADPPRARDAGAQRERDTVS